MRTAIVGLVLLCVIMLFGISVIVVYHANKKRLVEENLNINRVYAEKLADTTSQLFQGMQQTLGLMAPEISLVLADPKPLAEKLEIILKANQNFNSILAVSAEGKLLASAPDQGIADIQLNSSGVNDALREKRFLISNPYQGITGRLILLVSEPLWDKQGKYAGFLAGTIYLEQDNVLERNLGTHFYKDGSYVYVVDSQGSILYHPDRNRIGEKVNANQVVQFLMQGSEGSLQLTNTLGEEMLASFSYIPLSRWGIISQTPLQIALQPNQEMVRMMIKYACPFFLLILLLSVFWAHQIAVPLQRLAEYTEKSLDEEDECPFPEFRPWYYEAKQLAKTSRLTVEHLLERKNESLTDPLTGLYNRRAADKLIREWTEQGKPFALALIDADRFKRINDQLGHQAGDEALRFLANFLKENVREGDLCCRYGGEEFLLLLAGLEGKDAWEIVDDIRSKLSRTSSPIGQPLTISGGITLFPAHGDTPEALIHLADKSLYQAKEAGRNRTLLYC
ncbi:sensor domain-containing diguanylate cyclase [Brevibacillus fulvus]